MKESVAGEYPTVRLAPPPGLDGMADIRANLRARSQIVWGEHCSECGYPSCYLTCALYTPRPDGECRRFEAGIEAASLPGGERVMRIRFRRWGKLEGHGPAPMRAAATARRWEALDAAMSATLARTPLAFEGTQTLVRRWNRRKARATTGQATEADAFVVEGWTTDGAGRRFTLTFLQDRATRLVWQTAFDLGPNYGRLTVPAETIARTIDLTAPYLIQIEPIGEADGVDVVFGLIDFVAVRPASPAVVRADEAPLAKLVVWDLDETLWRGVLAEDGIAGVTLRPEAAAAIKALDARGVLHSIASKNSKTEALAALRAFGLADYFLHPQIGWGPKSAAIGRIAAGLDVGVDSFVFIDDQAFERAEAASAHPALRTLPETAVASLADHPWFDHPATAESRGRRELYRAAARRAAVLEEASGDYLGFLRASDLVLRIGALGPADAERVYELSQRTNQLNLTGARYSRETVAAMQDGDPGRARLVLRCGDRFGDYGLIGVADLDLGKGELTDFFMSCRVQKKRVEHAAFAYFAGLLEARGHDRFRVRFRATARNCAGAEMLKDLGFRRPPSDVAGLDVWERPLGEPFEDADIVRTDVAASLAA